MSELPISSIAEVNPPLPRSVADDELISFVRMQDVREGGGLIFTADRQFRSVRNGFTRFADNDVLFAKITPCMENGKGALCRGLTNGIGCGSTEFHVLRARGGHAPGFIYHLLQSQSVRQKAETRMSGSAGQQRVQADFFDTHCVWVPEPTAERRIAEILSMVDEAIEQTEALIAKYEQIKAGLMHDLFTRGLSPEASAKGDGTWKLRPTRAQAPHLYRESPLGWIPKEWDIVRVEDLCSDVVDCPHSTPTYTTSGVPCIRTADMQPGVLLLDQAYRVSEAEYIGRVARLVPQEGDIIYSREGERLGIASPVGRERVCLGQRVMLMRPTCETNSDFLLWAMNTSDFYRRILAGLGATTSPHINVGDIRKALLVQPSSAEQDLSGNLLARYSRLVRVEQTQLAKLRQVKHGLMHDLLSGRVRVEG